MLFTLIMLGMQTATKDTFADIPVETLERVAPNGFDIIPDGTVWINMAAPGKATDYAVKARDFLDRQLPSATVWIRGYHRRDPSVNYRVSMIQITMNCQSSTYQTRYHITYLASGAVGTEYQAPSYVREAPVVLGSQAANWQRFICQPK